MSPEPRPLPLSGITVLDLGQIYQGPYAGFLLAMAGARVIKVEQTRGEPLRARGDSISYAALNSSKETITLDLKSDIGHEMFLGLAEKADVVLVNFTCARRPRELGHRCRFSMEGQPKVGLCARIRFWTKWPRLNANGDGYNCSSSHGPYERHWTSRSTSSQSWSGIY